MLKLIAQTRWFHALLYYRYRLNQKNLTLYEEMQNRAVSDSADFVGDFLNEVLLVASRETLWDIAVNQLTLGSRIVELGVFKGYSINRLAKIAAKREIDAVGFDTFEGLQEPWAGTAFVVGSYSNAGKLPKTASNVLLKKGPFEETLPDFLAENDRKISLIHFDLDTYQSTIKALGLMREIFKPGLLMVFDEYLGYPNWRNGEHLAWTTFAENEGLAWKYLAFSNFQALIRIE